MGIAPTKAWTKLLGGVSYDEARSVSTVSDGSIYIAGYTGGSIDGQSNNSNGFTDSFITKFNSDGSKVWTKLLGGASSDYASSVSTVSDGSIYIAGFTSGSIDGQSNNGNNDAFITKLNSDGSSENTKTYTLAPSATSINEGAVLTSTVTTSNVVTGTKLYYALSGTGITTADFSAGALTGEGSTDATGKFTFTHTLTNDLTTEGAESLSIKLYSDTARTLQVGSTATVSVVDSSTTPVPTYTLTPSVSSINEGVVLTNTVTTSNVATGTKLYYALSGTGITTGDFSAGALTGEGVTDATGKFSIDLTLANDLLTEGAETVEIKLFSDQAKKVQIGTTATVSIADTSTTPRPQISVVAAANGKETDGSPVVFTFTRSGSTAAALTVNYQLFGTAQAGSDYTGNTSGSVSFAAGSAIATLSLPALADGALIDPYETIIARINPATNYEIATGKQFATATITAEGMVVIPKGASYSDLGNSSVEASNPYAFAALKSDGSVISWGNSSHGGIAPSGLAGVTQIFSSSGAFAALKSDGSVVTWGDSSLGGVAPRGLADVSQIVSIWGGFTALKRDGSVVGWGNIRNPPAGLTGVSKIFSYGYAFGALKSDGTVVSWGGDSDSGGVAPTVLTGVSKIISTYGAASALKSDGSVISWGYSFAGGIAPAGLTGIIQIFSNRNAFAALKSDGTVVSWGDSSSGGVTPAGLTNVSQIFSTGTAFSALKSDGSVISWGNSYNGGSGPAGLTGVSQIFSTAGAFAALRSDGTVITWGDMGTKEMGLTGVSQIFSTNYAFAALKSDGSVVSWGLDPYNKYRPFGFEVPAGPTGISQIFSNGQVFAAIKRDGSIICWGTAVYDKDGNYSVIPPSGLTSVVGFANPYTDDRLVLDEKPTPTYTLNPSVSSINEGSTLTTTIATTNVASGTTLYYSLSGTGVTTSDFSSGALTGSGSVASNGSFSFSHTFANDLTTEGSETLNIKLFSDSSRSTQVASTASVLINDTSTTPPTYSIGTISSINEGSTLTTSVATTNVASGTTLYYSLSGAGITSADFSSGALTGSGSVASNGSFYFSRTLANDLLTEGPETLNIQLFSNSSLTTQVGSTASVLINDTSITPTPTYTLTPSTTSINEGSTLTTLVATTNLSSGTTLYYSLSGNGITAADFSTGALTGLGTVGTDGKFSIIHMLANDQTTEGAETVEIKLFSDEAKKVQIGTTATVSIADTSTTPLPQISVFAAANGKETDGSPVVFTFARTGSTAAALSVSYQLFGTAQAGSDYTGNTSGSVSFAAGSATATLSLPALADGAMIDPYESIIARINPATNYGITTGKQFATATITAEGMVVIPKGVRIPGSSSGEQTNISAFAVLKSDGSVVSWGENRYGGNAPAGLTGVIQIFTSAGAFTALKSDGSVVSWGSKDFDGGLMTAPAGLTGVIRIFSNAGAFTALKSDGSVVSWGNTNTGSEAPAWLAGVSQVFSTDQAFAALKNDGSVICWGSKDHGGSAPAGLTGVSQIFSTGSAFAALKSDGTVICWGDEITGEAPAGLTGVIQISSGAGSFAALKNDGSVVSWGGASVAGLTGVSQIFSTSDAFAALKSDGSVVSWENTNTGSEAPPGLTSVSQIFSNENAFAALKSDGTVVGWGNSSYGGIAPAGLTGVSQIFSTKSAFAALKSDGSVASWGDSSFGGNAPAGLSGVSQIFSNEDAFAALKSDGTVVTWGGGDAANAPAGLTGVVGFANPFTDDRLVLDELTGKTLDFNGDGNVDSFDSILMMRHMMGTYPGESIKKDIPGKFDLTAIQRKLTNAFADTFSLNGGLRLDIDGDKRISAFRDGMMITQHILKQGTSDSPWAPPGFNPPAGFPAQMQQHLKDLIGF